MRKPKEPIKPSKPVKPEEYMVVKAAYSSDDNYECVKLKDLIPNGSSITDIDWDKACAGVEAYSSDRYGDLETGFFIDLGFEKTIKNPNYKKELAKYNLYLIKYQEKLRAYKVKLEEYNKAMVPYLELQAAKKKAADKKEIVRLEKQLANLKKLNEK